jgi:hypothetical protein
MKTTTTTKEQKYLQLHQSWHFCGKEDGAKNKK